MFSILFFFTDTATTEIYTLSLHDALPIYRDRDRRVRRRLLVDPDRAQLHRHHPHDARARADLVPAAAVRVGARSEEHTSELQSQSNLVCRLLLEKKKQAQLIIASPYCICT